MFCFCFRCPVDTARFISISEIPAPNGDLYQFYQYYMQGKQNLDSLLQIRWVHFPFIVWYEDIICRNLFLHFDLYTLIQGSDECCTGE